MTFDKEFKEAISRLPNKEKDKLLFRLLKKDIPLVNKLHFELVDTTTVDERREDMVKYVTDRVSFISETFYSIGYLNMDIRYLSGDITEHVKITKDKYGEVSLNLLLLKEVLRRNLKRIEKHTPGKSRKITTALLARIFKVLICITKLDEDFFIDFEEDLQTIGSYISQSDRFMQMAIHHGLDVNWLLLPEIPNNIVEIYRDLRQRGYLK